MKGESNKTSDSFSTNCQMDQMRQLAMGSSMKSHPTDTQTQRSHQPTSTIVLIHQMSQWTTKSEISVDKRKQ